MSNDLAKEKKIMAVSLLAEGSSIRAIERITGVHRDTIMRLGIRFAMPGHTGRGRGTRGKGSWR